MMFLLNPHSFVAGVFISLALPYTWVNKHIHLFPKLQGNMHLIPNMRLIMKAKSDHIQEIVPKLRMGNFKYVHFALSGCSLMYTFLVF